MSGLVYEHSAGGVLLDDGCRVLLIRTTNLKGEPVWTLPKGLIEPGETPEQAALREVREETGYAAEIVRALEPSTYWFVRDGRKVKKRVDWFLMRPLGKVGEHDHEVETAAWFTLEEALGRLRYRGDRDLVRRLLEEACAPGVGGP
ncbi:NUDIX hydrolase [Oceanithermus sp.]|uniref:NUDIX hydrolase n=1 Tax=Oceanithermus sp. TaxID=2268145 RepID=UPI0025E5CC8A|nr:NUDIX hydrolase [Oceanithermus sp.]